MFIANFSIVFLVALVHPVISVPVVEVDSIRANAERIVAMTHQDAIAPPGFLGAPQPSRERFWSVTNIALGTALLGSVVADIESTYSCLGASPHCVEGNPLQKQTIADGRWAVYPIHVSVNGLVWVFSQRMRRSPSKLDRVVGWVAPLTLATIKVGVAIHNIQLKHRLQGQQ